MQDMCIPKMQDNSKTKQQHSEAVDKFFDEYLHQKHTLNDLKLMQGVLASKEMADIKLDNINFEVENNDEQFSSKLNNRINEDTKEFPKMLSRMSISAVDLINEYEEQKMSSPKSSISVSKLAQEAKKMLLNALMKSNFKIYSNMLLINFIHRAIYLNEIRIILSSQILMPSIYYLIDSTAHAPIVAIFLFYNLQWVSIFLKIMEMSFLYELDPWMMMILN